MATFESISAQLDEIEALLAALPSQISVVPDQVIVVGGLSDIDQNIGLILSGEFRSGNGKEPGSGFTGVRIAYPAMTYNSETWHIVGVNSDALQVGIRATDGKFLAGAGAVVLDVNGITTIIGTSGEVKRSYTMKEADGTIRAQWSTYITGSVNLNSLLQFFPPSGGSPVVQISLPNSAGFISLIQLSSGNATLSVRHTAQGHREISVGGALEVLPVAATGAPPSYFLVNGAGHTALTAGDEWKAINFALADTYQFSTGALTTQRFMVIEAPTISFVGASTVTDAATVAITGAPAAGTNATITNAWALWVQAGAVKFADKLELGSFLTTNGNTGMSWRTKSITLADLATAQIGDVAKPAGPIFVVDSVDASVTMYWLRGGNNSVAEVSDPAGVFSPTSGTASSSNIYYSAGNARYEIENRRGAQRTYYIFFLQV